MDAADRPAVLVAERQDRETGRAVQERKRLAKEKRPKVQATIVLMVV